MKNKGSLLMLISSQHSRNGIFKPAIWKDKNTTHTLFFLSFSHFGIEVFPIKNKSQDVSVHFALLYVEWYLGSRT